MAKKTKKKGKIVDEVVEEELSDLLGIVEEDTQELLSEPKSPEVDEKTVLSNNSYGVTGRLVGFHPITKEPVYK